MDELINPDSETNTVDIVSWEAKQIAIDSITRLPLEDLPISELEDHLLPILKGTTMMLFPFPSGHNLFRGIKYAEKPLFWEDIIFPPPELAAINRANEAGEQIFYCSTVRKAAFYELDAKPGDRLILGNWVNTVPLFLNSIGYNLDEIIALAELYNAHIHFDLAKRDQLMDENNIRSNAYFKKTFSGKIETEADKKLTIAIARKFNESNTIGQEGSSTPFAGMIYHTIRLDSTADNMALKPAVIRVGMLELQKLEFMEIISVNEDSFSYKILDYAETIQNGKINWCNIEQGYSLNDESDDVYFVIDGDEVTLFNSEGDLIAPDQP